MIIDRPQGPKRALISSYRKEEIGLENYVRELVALGFEIISSGGTAKYLKKCGIQVTDIESIVGPPVLDHRVVTLSRELHGGLLAMAKEKHLAELAMIKGLWLDLVFVDPYPLEKIMADATKTPEEIREMIDIGGPAMLRSAAKGNRFSICSTKSLTVLIRFLSGEFADQTEISEQRLKFAFAADSEAMCSGYSAAASRFYAGQAGTISRDLVAEAFALIADEKK